MVYKDALANVTVEFDRVYLPRVLAREDNVVTRAARRADVTPKTFRRHWQEADLPPLADRNDPDGQ